VNRLAIDRLARLALALVALAGIASCGSGAVSGPPVTPTPPGDPLRIDIQPGTATTFSNTPTTFVITGGNGSYIVSSSNQSVIPVSGLISGNTLTVVPASVETSTEVTLTVRDTGTAAIATATLTVLPRTVSSTVTVTPTSTRCAPAICAGDDATVEATLTQNGAPLAGRPVRFEVISGDFRFITSASSATNETLDTSITATTDINGKARVRFRALTTAPTQSSLMLITDLQGGSFIRTGFSINGAPSAPTVIPEKVTVKGPFVGACPTAAAQSDFYIFGGVPPYSISNTSPSSLDIDRTVVPVSGGFFRVTTRANVCFLTLIIVNDAVGQRTIVSVEAIEGTAAAPVTPAPSDLSVAPTSVTLDSCDAVASVSVAGGTGSYQAVSSHSSVMVSPASSTIFRIQRVRGSLSAPPSVSISITDGRQSTSVTVTLTPAGTGPCPP
jgi:hypothetical protein